MKTSDALFNERSCPSRDIVVTEDNLKVKNEPKIKSLDE